MNTSSPVETRKAPNSCSIPFGPGHNELIHAVAYDYYGQRIATCSSDQKIKIFDMTENGDWVENDSWHAHEATIVKVAWSQPEFGQIIATCSFDRTFKVFEEQETEPKRSGKRWKQMYRQVSDSRGAVFDIAFAPAFAGLKLAMISFDGIVQIQEPIEPYNLSRWESIDIFRAIDEMPQRELETSFCLAFCPSRWGGEQLVIGAMDKVRVFRHNSQGKYRPAEELPGHKGLVRDVAWAPNLGRGYHLIATACKDHHLRIFKLTDPNSTFAIKPSRPPSRSGDHSRFFKDPSYGNASNKAGNQGLSNNTNLQVQGTSTPQQFEEDMEAQETRELQGFDVVLMADFDDHHHEVWRVEWNATGTILSSAGDDGKIRLWRIDKQQKFTCMSIIASNWKPNNMRRAEEDEY